MAKKVTEEEAVTKISFAEWLSDKVAESVVVDEDSKKARFKAAKNDYSKGIESVLAEFNSIEKSYPNNKSHKNIELLSKKLCKGAEYAELREYFAGVCTEYIVEGFANKHICGTDDYDTMCKLSEGGELNFDNYTSTTNAIVDNTIDGVDDTEFLKRTDSTIYGESEYPDTWARQIAAMDV